MKTLFVRFSGDNDFISTVTPFVKALATKVFFGAWKDITKEQIVEEFNASAYVFYRMYQATDLKEARSKQLRGYLRIEVKDVLFDEEVSHFAASGQWNGDGCVAYLDHNNDLRTYAL